MRVVLLALLLPVVCQATRLISLANNQFDSRKYEIDTVDPATGQFTKLFDQSVSFLFPPACSALRDNGTVVYCNMVLPDWTSELITVDLSTGNIQKGPHNDYNIFVGVGYDKVTKQTFVITIGADLLKERKELGVLPQPLTVRDLRESHPNLAFGLYELLPTQELRKLGEISEADFNGEYSSTKHMFILNGGSVVPYVSNMFCVGTVGEQAGKILYNVTVNMAITGFVYDDTFGVLYAWGVFDSRTSKLVSLDYTTGEILKTFFESSTVSATPIDSILPTCIDKAGSTIYSALFDIPSNAYVIHTLNLSTGNATQAPADRLSIMTMDCQ